MDTSAVILDAVERVAGGRDDALVVHSARDSNLWVQISRVEGQTSLLFEAGGDEYPGRRHELAAAAAAPPARPGARAPVTGGAAPPHQPRRAPFDRELLDVAERRS